MSRPKNDMETDVIGIAHDQQPPQARFDCVIHAGRDPKLGQAGYDVTRDCELRIADWARLSGTHFVHLGSRKVYKPSDRALVETDAIGPVDRYGEHKLAMENSLRSILGEHLLILRIGYAFGFETGRRSFFGAMLAGLAQNQRIDFDMHPSVARDFAPVGYVAEMILALAKSGASGIVNVGSGISIETGSLAHALIEGYGDGELVCNCDASRDAFVLDISKSQKLTGLSINENQIIVDAQALGTQLRAQLA